MERRRVFKKKIPVDGFSTSGVNVRVSNLVKIYRIGRSVEVQALRGLSMYVKAGEAVIVMGPSGSGKTTLLNIIGGVDKPTGGSVVVGDTYVHKLSEKELERYRLCMVGYVFQSFNLIPVLTVLENIELPMIALGIEPSIRRRRALWLIRQVGLEERAHHHPSELSGGEQQRAAIAVALANDPPLILADEPTAELDSENALKITSLLISLSREYGKTVIISTHDPRIAVRANRILRIEDGVIKGEYTPLEVVSEKARAVSGEDLVSIVKARLAEVEKSIEDLVGKLGRGDIGLEDFDREYSRLRSLANAYRELLASLGH